jgi:hypothetical protein
MLVTLDFIGKIWHACIDINLHPLLEPFNILDQQDAWIKVGKLLSHEVRMHPASEEM